MGLNRLVHLKRHKEDNPHSKSSSSHNHTSVLVARGDGVTDDTKAFQKAIKHTPSGGTLIIPMGTFSIRSHIKIIKPITITGAGTLQCDMHVTGWTHMIMVRCDHCTINGVQFFNKTGNEGIGAISVEGNDFKLTNCVIENFYEGIMLGNMVVPGHKAVHHSRIQIMTNKFLNVHGVTGGSICHGDAISFFGCTDVSICNNVITAASGKTPRNGINSGPEGYIRSTRIMISDNQVLGDWDYPITTEWGTCCQIVNNFIDGQCIAGIIERGDEILVSGNKVNVRPGKRDGNVCGIQFYGVDKGTISNNFVTGEAKYAIMCTPSHETQKGSYTQVIDNNVDGDFFYCVYFGDTDHSSVLRNNLRTTHKEETCIGVHGWQNKNFSCQLNTVQTLHGTAFILVGTNTGDISQNRTVNTRCGVYIGKDSHNIHVLHNDFTSCTGCVFDKHPNSSVVQSQSLGPAAQ